MSSCANTSKRWVRKSAGSWMWMTWVSQIVRKVARNIVQISYGGGKYYMTLQGSVIFDKCKYIRGKVCDLGSGKHGFFFLLEIVDIQGYRQYISGALGRQSAGSWSALVSSSWSPAQGSFLSSNENSWRELSPLRWDKSECSSNFSSNRSSLFCILYIIYYQKFRGPPGPNFQLLALRAGLTSSFAPFGRSGRVTHAIMWSLDSVIVTFLFFVNKSKKNH